MQVPNFATDLIGARVRAKAREGYTIDGRPVVDASGTVRAIGFDGMFTLLIHDIKSNTLRTVHSSTHDIEYVHSAGVVT